VLHASEPRTTARYALATQVTQQRTAGKIALRYWNAPPVHVKTRVRALRAIALTQLAKHSGSVHVLRDGWEIHVRSMLMSVRPTRANLVLPVSTRSTLSSASVQMGTKVASARSISMSVHLGRVKMGANVPITLPLV